MKKILVVIVIFGLFAVFYYFHTEYNKNLAQKYVPEIIPVPLNITKTVNQGLSLLEQRRDRLALVEFERVLEQDRLNKEALWGKAEVLRREYKFSDAEKLLEQILSQDPGYIPALVSHCYILYHDNELTEATQLAKDLLDRPDIDIKNKAIVYMLIASINARRASTGGFFSKLSYGTQIKGYFQKAVDLAPQLSEAHLGLGSFYLKAPLIAGGNIDKAIAELQAAVKLTPDFATANARLAQAYKKKGDLEKFNYYLKRAKELDPANEAVKEIENEQ